MIPAKIQRRADELVARIQAGELRPHRLEGRESTLVVRMGIHWRLVDVAAKGNWQVMSHEKYNRYCCRSRNHAKGNRPVRNF